MLKLLCCIFSIASAVRFTPRNNVKDWPNSQSLELFQYVAEPDPSFEYFDTGLLLNSNRKYGDWMGYLLNVTSQTWRTLDEVSISKWTHTLAVIVPDQLDIIDQGFLYLTGGDNVPYDVIEEDRGDILEASAIALKTHSIVSVMFQIPNQPIVFNLDPLQKQRVEDAIVGFTWFEFFRNTSRPELLSHVPMTKAGVRGMDTIQHFCEEKGISDIKRFVIAGASKRGWTTWLVGAVDQRVKAIIPLVMDLLHFQTNLIHHYQSLGGWSFAFEDYYKLGLTGYINTPLMSRMGQVIDIATYIKYLDIPKLVIGATGDEFFLLDDDHYWWGELPGKTWRLIIPNAEHSLETGLITAIEGVSGFYYAILRDKPIPNINWKVERLSDQTTLYTTLSQNPSLVVARKATTLTETRRDFRLVISGENCTFLKIKDKYCIQPVLWSVELLKWDRDLTYTVKDAKPYTAFLLEFTFPIDERTLIFTTQVVITPDKLPYEPPRDGELGKLK
jgi:PhoPQ-activated pathogenicity-related protein